METTYIPTIIRELYPNCTEAEQLEMTESLRQLAIYIVNMFEPLPVEESLAKAEAANTLDKKA
jgi:hypothetical protein